MKLLYAEDEETMAEAVVDILTYHNYLVDTVADGAEALAYAQNGDYDGIILDVMMPKMDGLEVLSRLPGDGMPYPILLLTAKGLWKIRLPAWIWGQMTIYQSHLLWRNFWPGCVPCSGGGRHLRQKSSNTMMSPCMGGPFSSEGMEKQLRCLSWNTVSWRF